MPRPGTCVGLGTEQSISYVATSTSWQAQDRTEQTRHRNSSTPAAAAAPALEQAKVRKVQGARNRGVRAAPAGSGLAGDEQGPHCRAPLVEARIDVGQGCSTDAPYTVHGRTVKSILTYLLACTSPSSFSPISTPSSSSRPTPTATPTAATRPSHCEVALCRGFDISHGRVYLSLSLSLSPPSLTTSRRPSIRRLPSRHAMGTHAMPQGPSAVATCGWLGILCRRPVPGRGSMEPESFGPLRACRETGRGDTAVSDDS